MVVVMVVDAVVVVLDAVVAVLGALVLVLVSSSIRKALGSKPF